MRSSFLQKYWPKITEISVLPSNKLPGQKSETFLVGILGETMTSKIHSEFNWPLNETCSSSRLYGFKLETSQLWNELVELFSALCLTVPSFGSFPTPSCTAKTCFGIVLVDGGSSVWFILRPTTRIIQRIDFVVVWTPPSHYKTSYWILTTFFHFYQ